MEKSISVSIIVPVYNSEKYIENLLNDIIKQSFSDFEVIIINDGSQDGSQAILERYARKDQRIHPIEVKNSGVSKARNLGLSLAKGKYIRFVDADDRLEADSLQYLMEVAEKDEDLDLIIGSFRSIPEVNLYYGEHAINGKQTLEQMSLDFLFNIRSFYYGVVWNKLYKREIIQKYNIKFNEKMTWCEDFIFNLDYFEYCKWFYFLPVNKQIYNYVQHASSTTQLVHRIPKEKIQEINSLRTERTKLFFEQVGLEKELQLEWKYSFLFFNLFEIAKKKNIGLRERYAELKNSLSQEGVLEYIGLKKNYFSDDFFYHFVFYSVKVKCFFPLFLYVLICGWLAKHMNWVKYLWLKIGGKRPKVL